MVRANPARSDRQVLLGGVECLERRDCPAALGISDVALLEGTRTSPLARFVVSLSEKSSSAVTVNWQTSDGTATVADGDYRPASGTLFFAAGQVSKVITVYVRGDARVEETETFNVRLSGAVGATLVRTEATGTILNDDEPPAFVPQPELSIADVELIEKNTGRSEARFTVALSAATNVPVSVRWATKNGTATAADRDYLAASSKLVFAPGERVKTFAVSVLGDTRIESDESFTVSLSDANGATISRGTGTAMIRNDDVLPLPPVVVSVAGVSVVEGNGGADAPAFAACVIRLSRPADRVVTVSYQTFDGTATVLDRDYTATGGTAVFAIGETMATVLVPIVGDVKSERDESFSLRLLSADGASLPRLAATVIIEDDDTPPLVGVAGGSVTEGNSGNTALPFLISLSGPWTRPIVVTYETRDGTATVGDTDYVTASGSVTFAPGETLKTIDVSVNGDTRPEIDESFSFVLTAADGATLAGNRATGIIRNDDSGEVPGFQITVDYVGTVRQSIKDACDWAVARWSQVIVGDLAGVWDTEQNVFIDDLRIKVQEGLLGGGDGPGGALANAGPERFREGAAGLPWDAVSGIDPFDASNPQLRNILLHEFGHALGFGISGGGTPNFYSRFVVGDGFTGPNAVQAYNTVFRNTDRSVPLETGGGAGTAGAHWRETVLRTELMTGFVEPAGVPMPLSSITVGAMQDLGYTVSVAAADPFSAPSLAAAGSVVAAPTALTQRLRSPWRANAVPAVSQATWIALGR